MSSEIEIIGFKAKKASDLMSNITGDQKNNALFELKKNLNSFKSDLIEANKIDINNAKSAKLSSSIIDRLSLNQDTINGMISGLEEIIELENPVGRIISEWTRPNGLLIKKISVPLGVIGIIYESRPNVTIDAAAIAIKSGNAIILRGGKDSFYSSQKLNQIITLSISKAGLPSNAIQMISSTDRAAIDEMLSLNQYIDVIIPRGGKGLINTINKKSSIPVIKHLDGICHIFVEKEADLKKAKEIIYNSKMRRPGICGAVETLLIDRALLDQIEYFLQPLVDSKCEIRGDNDICNINPKFKKANEEDWSTEYLDKIISVKIVEGVNEAIRHVSRHSSHHTESIVTENPETCKKFFKEIDSAILLQNASTQYADGGEFGFGAEIGISTDKLHVRGPVGAEHLTSFKYLVYGNGQVRP